MKIRLFPQDPTETKVTTLFGPASANIKPDCVIP
jgi:hypothetical protein